MREIIFRGKRTNDEKWVEGSLLVFADRDSFICCSDFVPNCQYKYEIDPSTIGQYTGLADKAGRKIFEGDVVRTNKYGKDDGAGHNSAGNDIFYVEFRDGGYRLFNGWRRFNLRPDTGVEIIGNIHDNPELREEAPHA